MSGFRTGSTTSGGGVVGTVSTANSTTTPLAGGASFTGSSTSVLNNSNVEVIVYSDQASAAGGVLIEFSSDGTNWDDSSTFTFTPGSAGPNQGQSFVAGVRGQYCRVVYTNGATPQATFRLQTVLKSNIVGGDVVSVNGTVLGNQHGLLTVSEIVGLTTGGGGGYVPVKVNPSGTLTVDASGTTVTVTGSVTANPPAQPTVPLYGQTKVAVTNTAVQLPSHAISTNSGVIVQALSANAGSVYIGDASVTTANGFELQPGQAAGIAIANTNDLYVNGTAGDGVCFLGS